MTRAFMLKAKEKRKNKLKKTLCCTQADAHLRQYHKHVAASDFAQALGALKQAFLAFKTAGAKDKMNDIRALECRTRGDGLMQQSKAKLDAMEYEDYINHLEHARDFFKYYTKSRYYKRLQHNNKVAAKTELKEDAARVDSVRNIQQNCLNLAQQRGLDSMHAAGAALEPPDGAGGRVSSDKLALVKEYHAAVVKSFSWLEKNGIEQPAEITNSIKELTEGMNSSKLQGQAAVVFQAMIRINVAKRALEFNLFVSQLKKCKNYILHRYLMKDRQDILEPAYLQRYAVPFNEDNEQAKGLQAQEDLLVIAPLKLVEKQLLKYAERSRSMMPKMLFFMDNLQVIDQLVAALPLITVAHEKSRKARHGASHGHKHHHKQATEAYDKDGHAIQTHHQPHHQAHHQRHHHKDHLSTPVAILKFLQCTAAVMPNTFNTKRQSFLSKQIMQHSPLARVFQCDAERKLSMTRLPIPQTEIRPPRGDSIEDKWIALHPMATTANIQLKPEHAAKMPKELVITVLSTVLAEGSVKALTVGVEVLQLMLKWNLNTTTQTLAAIHEGGGTKVLMQVFDIVSSGNEPKKRRPSIVAGSPGATSPQKGPMTRRLSRRGMTDMHKQNTKSGSNLTRRGSKSNLHTMRRKSVAHHFDMAKIGTSLIAGTHVLRQLLTDSEPSVRNAVYRMLDANNVLPSLVILLKKQLHDARFVWQFLNLLISIAEFPTAPPETAPAASSLLGTAWGAPPPPEPEPDAPPRRMDWNTHAVEITKTLMTILEYHSLSEAKDESHHAARRSSSSRSHKQMTEKEQFVKHLEDQQESVDAKHTEEQSVYKMNCVRGVARLVHRMVTINASVAQRLIDPKFLLFDVLTKLLEEPQPQQGEETMILATEALLCEVRVMQPYFFRVFGKRGPSAPASTPAAPKQHIQVDGEEEEAPVLDGAVSAAADTGGENDAQGENGGADDGGDGDGGADRIGRDRQGSVVGTEPPSPSEMSDKDIYRIRCVLEALTTRMSACPPGFINFAEVSCRLACTVTKQVPDLALPEMCAATLKILKIFAPSRIGARHGHVHHPRAHSHEEDASAPGMQLALNLPEGGGESGGASGVGQQRSQNSITRVEVYLAGARALELLLCADSNLQLLHDQGVTGVLSHAFRSFQAVPDTNEKLKLPLLETLTAGMVKMVCSSVVIEESGIMGGGSSSGGSVSVSKSAINEMNDEGMYPLMTQLASHFCGELEFLHMTAENVKQEMHKSRHSTPRGSVVSPVPSDGDVVAPKKKGLSRFKMAAAAAMKTTPAQPAPAAKLKLKLKSVADRLRAEGMMDPSRRETPMAEENEENGESVEEKANHLESIKHNEKADESNRRSISGLIDHALFLLKELSGSKDMCPAIHRARYLVDATKTAVKAMRIMPLQARVQLNGSLLLMKLTALLAAEVGPVGKEEVSKKTLAAAGMFNKLRHKGERKKSVSLSSAARETVVPKEEQTAQLKIEEQPVTAAKDKEGEKKSKETTADENQREADRREEEAIAKGIGLMKFEGRLLGETLVVLAHAYENHVGHIAVAAAQALAHLLLHPHCLDIARTDPSRNGGPGLVSVLINATVFYHSLCEERKRLAKRELAKLQNMEAMEEDAGEKVPPEDGTCAPTMHFFCSPSLTLSLYTYLNRLMSAFRQRVRFGRAAAGGSLVGCWRQGAFLLRATEHRRRWRVPSH
jgi:hypothetical protein